MFGSMRVVAPYAGKTELAKARMRTAAEIISQSGASDVWMASVLGGYGAGNLHLYGWFESMTQVMEVSGNVHSDPAWQALMAEREANPAADIAAFLLSQPAGSLAGDAVPDADDTDRRGGSDDDDHPPPPGGGGAGGGSGGKGGKGTCFQCGRPGHFARDCHAPPGDQWKGNSQWAPTAPNGTPGGPWTPWGLVTMA